MSVQLTLLLKIWNIQLVTYNFGMFLLTFFSIQNLISHNKDRTGWFCLKKGVNLSISLLIPVNDHCQKEKKAGSWYNMDWITKVAANINWMGQNNLLSA